MTRKVHERRPALAEMNFRKYAERLKEKTHSEIFSVIHDENVWGSKTSKSGLGSELESTKRLRAEMLSLVERHQIKSVLDIPCGDLHWMRHARLPINKYMGADIVPSVIKELERKGVSLSTETGDAVPSEFAVLDLMKDVLPTVDLVICRDCIVHFSFADANRAVSNIKRSGSKYLLATTFTELSSNIDVQTGDWRPLNMEKPPLMFPKALEVFEEGCEEMGDAYSDKSMGLWRIDDLPPIPGTHD